MINEKLQDFATGVMARSQIGFGDVRRLQRDCLPHGITTRDEAKSLVALNAKLVRADKAWAAWLVPALADFVMAQQPADAAGADEAKAWLRGLLAQSPCGAALGRKIARHVRRQSAQVAERIARIVRSEIVVTPPRHALTRPRLRATGAPSLPCELWSAGIIEKHLRFQLARPAV